MSNYFRTFTFYKLLALKKLNTLEGVLMKSISPEIPFKTQDIIDLRMENIIPISSKVLHSKFETILDYNQEKLEGKVVSFEQYIENKELLNSDITPVDIMRIKTYLKDYYINNKHAKWFELDTDYSLHYFKQLTLRDIHAYYIRALRDEVGKDIILRDNQIETISSIKIYDFYRNSKDKNNFLTSMLGTAKYVEPRTKKIEVLSIFDTQETVEFYEKLQNVYNSNSKEKITIKHMTNSQDSYIPSIFFVLIKFKVAKSNVYKEYIFYLEEEINWGVASYVNNKNFSKQFYSLLEKRFDTQFEKKDNIVFHAEHKPLEFENEVHNIFEDLKLFIELESDNIEEQRFKVNEIRNQLIHLKLEYPKMNYAYKLLSRLIKYISVIQEINIETRKKHLDNTQYIIKKLMDNELNFELDKQLEKISTNYLLTANKIDKIKVRKSIFINQLGQSSQAICDLFEELPWHDLKSILTSLQEIEFNRDLLEKFFISYDEKLKSLSYIDMRKVFKENILQQIYDGKKISISL